ncbi:glycosyltransferase family 4 protein [candidate division TA06 bacterium]|uniref:Glycosyltransferase family 4 protein n=1 Tax=candidate division TA06 bacterium TaxID=2250710 RepID=A0A933ML33_UNCT6|nr:glycosyltransferase family 4 protein [candidate division TA06 bacterium]
MESSLEIKGKGPKPFFWWRCSRAYRHQENVHLVSQNLSFLKAGNKRIVTCLDLIPLFMPSSLLEKCWRGFLYSGIKKADHVISISQATKKDLVRIYKLDPRRVTPVLLGVTPEFKPYNKRASRELLGLPREEKIILQVGTAAPRKNFITTLKAFDRIARGNGNIRLVKVNPAGIKDKEFIARSGLSSKVLVRESAAKEHMPHYYAAADVFVFPSLYEGFGLPVLEAMACGCPVIASNNSSIPEVVGEAGIMIDPLNEVLWKEMILSVLSDQGLSQKLSAEGLERARLFTWQKTAGETLQVYQKIFKNSS